MKCIETDVIPEHISESDRRIILEQLLFVENDTQIQSDDDDNAFININNTKKSLINQVKTICDRLDIEYVKPAFSCERKSFRKVEATTKYGGTVIRLHKTVYDMTDEEKIATLHQLMCGWGSSHESYLFFIKADKVKIDNGNTVIN